MRKNLPVSNIKTSICRFFQKTPRTEPWSTAADGQKRDQNSSKPRFTVWQAAREGRAPGSPTCRRPHDTAARRGAHLLPSWLSDGERTCLKWTVPCPRLFGQHVSWGRVLSYTWPESRWPRSSKNRTRQVNNRWNPHSWTRLPFTWCPAS